MTQAKEKRKRSILKRRGVEEVEKRYHFPAVRRVRRHLHKVTSHPSRFRSIHKRWNCHGRSRRVGREPRKGRVAGIRTAVPGMVKEWFCFLQDLVEGRNQGLGEPE